MKYCSKCGAQLLDEAVICPSCGCPVENSSLSNVSGNQTLQTVAMVFMIICTIALAITIIPLIYAIPMCIHYNNVCKRGEKVGVGFAICVLLFMSPISGILMLLDR